MTDDGLLELRVEVSLLHDELKATRMSVAQWQKFSAELLAYAEDQEARLKELDGRVRALEPWRRG